MEITEKEKMILRGLAKRLAEIASLPIQDEKKKLWRRLNRLERVRPMIILQNDTWHETGHQIKLETSNNFCREQEWYLRITIYHYEHMKDDTVYEAQIYSPIVIHCTSMGIEVKTTDPDHVFGARHYHCVIPDDADPSIIPMPAVTVDWEETERLYQLYKDIYDGILEVEKRGVWHFWFSPMDTFFTWRGIEKAFTDLIDKPQWVHAWMQRITDWHLSVLEQYEKLNLLSLNNRSRGVDFGTLGWTWNIINVGVGPGGLGFTDELPQPDFDGVHVRTKDLWGHATTQIFSLVSPAMHEEFALQYERQYLSKFGLASYGCCEPLHMKIDIIERNISNLRRISVSPWADVEKSIEAIGKKFIFSYKPHPGVLGMEIWDKELARKQLRDVFEKTRGCVIEVVMKDLHTCHNEPHRMWEWVEMAMKLAEEYA